MKLLAVDSNSILNRAYYGVKPLTTREGQFTNGIYGFLNILLKLIEENAPDAVAFAFDLRAPTFRHKMFDGYKAGRKGMPEELAQQVEPLKELLTLMGYPILSLEGYEADDILGTLGERCRAAGDECVIATGGPRQLPARRRRGNGASRLYPWRPVGRRGHRRGGNPGEVRRLPPADDRGQGADGRFLGQHPRRRGHRRKDRPRPHSAVRHPRRRL